MIVRLAEIAGERTALRYHEPEDSVAKQVAQYKDVIQLRSIMQCGRLGLELTINRLKFIIGIINQSLLKNGEIINATDNI